MPRRKGIPLPAILPNHGSKNATPASLKIDLHYAKRDIFTRWNFERFLRLAAFLKLTPYELGSLAGIAHKDVDLFREANVLVDFRNRRHYAAAILLTNFEWHATKAFTDDVVNDVFPNLSQSP